ncbi:MDR family MFS transporter [Fictibacillus aquaticus]|uniref:MFS transporter n=1 Tax=Fictibacillus aquaticus TaxID=2021314 RepID=A0A235FB90_9BACL|nr:MDR family MFS transporter [Fictibacillus aquaticus]OYD58606.1 MFS transporter [Fictibacillus aquaticus]
MRKQIMSALLLVTVLSAMEGTIVSTAIPRITSDLSGIELVSWVYAVYLLAMAVTTPIYGKLADLFGRKKVILTGVTLFLAGSALCGLSQSMEQLIIFRAIQGLGAGAVMPITMTIIGDLYTENKERAKAQGWISAVWGVSGVIGPLLGGFIVDNLTWHYIFFLNVPFGLLAIFMLAANYKEIVTKEKRHVDYQGAVTFSIATIAVLYALLAGSMNQNWDDPMIIGLFFVAVLAYSGFVFIEKKSPDPLIPLNVFSNRGVLTVNILTLLVFAVVVCMTIYLPIWTQGVLGKSATQAGLVLMPLPVCWTIGAMAVGSFVGKVKENWIVTVGTAIVSVSSLIFFTLSDHSPDFIIYAASGLLGLGMGLMTPVFMLIIQSSVPSSKRGIAVATNSFTATFSQTLGSAVLGSIFNIITIAKAEKGGQDDLDLNASFNHAELPAEKLSQLQDILASGVHVIYGVMLLLALLAFALSFLLRKSSE